jgi:hypothetical protein
LCAQVPLQQVTHQQIYQLQQQLNQAVNTKQQDIEDVYQVRAMSHKGPAAEYCASNMQPYIVWPNGLDMC